MGENVKGFEKGDRCVADVGLTVRHWDTYSPVWHSPSCISVIIASIADVASRSSVRTTMLAELLKMVASRIISFSESPFRYQEITSESEDILLSSSKQHKLYKIHNLSDEEATLLEPAACAIHGLDKLAPPVGIEVLVLGAGPTGLILAQLLKLNGASRVVIAANKGIKMDIAKQLDCGDEYIELDRQNPAPQWVKLKDDNKYGFDVVVEATGVEKLADESINYVRRGGTLMIYGVYENKARVHWPPSKIFGDEIRVCFRRRVTVVNLLRFCLFLFRS